MIGLYRAGTSPLHRLGAGTKLALLGAGLLAVTVLASPTTVVVGALVLVVLTVVAGLGWQPVAAQVRPVLWLVGLLAGVQWWAAGPQAAVTSAGSIVVAVAAAAVVTLTTRTQDLLDAVVRVVRPLRVVGVDADRVALVLALAVRSIPVVAGLAQDVSQARAARGATRSQRAFAVPLVIRTVRYADRLGEALAARGVDD